MFPSYTCVCFISRPLLIFVTFSLFFVSELFAMETALVNLLNTTDVCKGGKTLIILFFLSLYFVLSCVCMSVLVFFFC